MLTLIEFGGKKKVIFHFLNSKSFDKNLGYFEMDFLFGCVDKIINKSQLQFAKNYNCIIFESALNSGKLLTF